MEKLVSDESRDSRRSERRSDDDGVRKPFANERRDRRPNRGEGERAVRRRPRLYLERYRGTVTARAPPDSSRLASVRRLEAHPDLPSRPPLLPHRAATGAAALLPATAAVAAATTCMPLSRPRRPASPFPLCRAPSPLYPPSPPPPVDRRLRSPLLALLGLPGYTYLPAGRPNREKVRSRFKTSETRARHYPRRYIAHRYRVYPDSNQRSYSASYRSRETLAYLFVRRSDVEELANWRIGGLKNWAANS